MPAPPKPPRRAALERPFAREHDASRDATWRHPQSLRDLLREFRDACDAELPGRLHGHGVESEQGVTVRQAAAAIASGSDMPVPPISGGSHMGGPRWTAEFRSYLDAGGSAFATYVDDHGEEQWAYPLRSSIKRMEQSRSNVDRSAAEYLYLLRRCRGNPREAWAAQVGPLLARATVLEVANAWAGDALSRWWGHYVERPRGRILT